MQLSNSDTDSDTDSDYDSSSVTSKSSEKRKANTDSNEIFKKPKLARGEKAEPRRGENVEETSREVDRWNIKKPYQASGAKNVLHGTVYQLKHLMLILNRARKKGCAFSLSTEMDAAEKFDDLVFEYEDSPGNRIHRFLQMKHKQHDEKKISVGDLLAEDDSNFSVVKYFRSWGKIKKNPDFAGSKSKSFFICTNISLDVDKIDKNIMSFVKVEEPDEFLNVTYQKVQPPRYKIVLDKQSKLYVKLKSASDLHRLAKALAQCVNGSKKLELKTDIYERYHIALAREVLDIKNGVARFSVNFIKGNGLGDTVKKFRNVFIGYYQQDLASKSFTTSPKFGRTSETGSYTLPCDEITDAEISAFLNEFILAVDQPNENELRKMMVHEFSDDTWFNLINADFIVDSFQNRILEWFKHKQGVPFVNEDADRFFSELQRVLSSLVISGITSVYLENLKKYDIKFKSESKDVLKFLRSSKSVTKPKLLLISSKKTFLTALRVYQTVKRMRKYKKKDSHVFVGLEALLLPAIKKQIANAFKSPHSNNLLVVDCESISIDGHTDELWKALFKILKDKTDKRIIIMTHANDPSFKEFKKKYTPLHVTDDGISINNLETSTQQKLLNRKLLKVQGRDKKISFARLLGTDIFDNVDPKELEDCSQMISSKTLVKLICEEDIKMGDKVMGWEEIEEYYIPRTIDPHVIIKVDVITDPEICDIIAVSGIDEERLETLLASQGGSQSSDNNSQPYPKNYVLLRSGQERDDFGNLCKKNSSDKIHWLQYVSKKFILKQSFGSIADLIKYRTEGRNQDKTSIRGTIPPTEELAQAAYDDRNKIVILSDTAGMGKSTVLTRLAEGMKDKKMFVIRIDLTQRTTVLASELMNRSFTGNDTDIAIEFLLKKLSDCGADQDSETYSAFKTVIKWRGEAALLFDGFDEIVPDYKTVVIELLQALANLPVKKLFVTTRPYMSRDLEENLGVFAHTMQPFSRPDQEEFLIKFWRRELNNKKSVGRQFFNEADLLKHARRVLSLLGRSIDRSMQEFTGNPLQTRMVAEVFSYDEKLPRKIKIIDLYSQLVDKKLRIFSEEKNRSDHTIPGVKEIEESMRFFTLKEHQKLALDALFGEEIVRMLLDCQPDIIELCKRFADRIEAKLRLGIVTTMINNKPIFVHRTFAEYFAAHFLFHTLRDDRRNEQVREFFVEQLFIDLQYRTIRVFLNSLLEGGKYDDSKDFWKFDLIEHRNAEGETAYHVAARERNVEIAKFLLNKLHEQREVQFSNINCPSENGKTPLIVAVETVSNSDVVKCFVEAGANIESKTNEGETPLHLAISSGSIEIAKYLIKEDANIEAKTKAGLTPLHSAAQSGNLSMVKDLSKRGANVNSLTKDESTLLHLAASYGKLTVVKHLVKEGSEVDSRNTDGNTPLHLATEYGKSTVVMHLVEKGSKVDSQNTNGKTPLHLAAEYGKLTVVEYLVMKSAEVNARDEHGMTALHLAIKYGKLTVAEHLVREVKEGETVDYRDNNGQTPLHLASESGNLPLVELLIVKHANIESQDVKGWAPLHVAVGKGKTIVVKYLVEAGANIESKTVDGLTALDIARNLKKRNVFKYLR